MDLALTAIIFGVAAFLQGVAGFGSALLAMPLLTLFLPVREAVPASILLGLALNGQMALNYRSQLKPERIKPLVWGLIPGVVFGIFALKGASEYGLKTFMAWFLGLYAVYGLFFERTAPVGLSSRWGYLAGFASAALGTAFSTGGPPVVVYTTLPGWPKDEVKATLACFFFVTCVTIVLAHAGEGLITWRVAALAAVSLPTTWLGTRLGIAVSRRIKERNYRRMLYALLLCMGLMMWASA